MCSCAVADPCRTICNPVDCSSLGASVHGIFQARILDWVLFPPSEALPDSGIKPTSPAMQETCVQSPGQEEPLEKEMETHSSILAWRIPRTKEPGRSQSLGSQRVGRD